jgi:catechol 2,3-dioxygenase-like lactoylglutathione lyase family enzyme
MSELASVVLFAANPLATAAFYRALGLVLEDEHHGDGPVHFATELGTVHFAIYPAQAPGRAPERRTGGNVFHCRVVAEDPDGRAVEINQRGHCPG